MWLGVLVASSLIIVALAAPVVANDDGTTSHLWNDHIKPMKQPGTINSATNPVDWTKLKGVPAGLADGVDDGVEAAGFGLNKATTTFGPILSVDPTQVQRRVIGGCGPGRAIREIVQDGSIDCDPVSQGLSYTDNDTGTICMGPTSCTEGILGLSAGTWAVSAKIIIQRPDPDDYFEGGCVLGAGLFTGLSDDAEFAGQAGTVTLHMQGIAALADPATASVSCVDYYHEDTHGYELSIVAIRVGG